MQSGTNTPSLKQMLDQRKTRENPPAQPQSSNSTVQKPQPVNQAMMLPNLQIVKSEFDNAEPLELLAANFDPNDDAQLRLINQELVEHERQKRNIRLPDFGGDLVTRDGQVNLSMDSCPAYVNQKKQTENSVHLYLGGVVNIVPTPNIPALVDINSKLDLQLATAAADQKIYDVATMLQHPNEPLRKAHKHSTIRFSTTRNMIASAYHLSYLCRSDFGLSASQMTLKHYVPQKHARHTIEKSKLFTDTELFEAIKKFPVGPSAYFAAFGTQLREELEEEAKGQTPCFRSASQKVTALNGLTGYSYADQPLISPYMDVNRNLCNAVWTYNTTRSSPIKSGINEILPIDNDLDMLKGGLIYDAPIHEALMHNKKTLAVGKYAEMASRMTTPGCFRVFLLHDVPLTFAGSCVEQDGTLKVTDLEGSVSITPVAKFTPPEQKQQDAVREIFKNQMPVFMETLHNHLKADVPQKVDAVQFNEFQPYICEILFHSSRADCPPISITTNVQRRHHNGQNEIWLRDPGVNRTLWPRDFIQNALHQNPKADHLDFVKQNPAKMRLNQKTPQPTNRYVNHRDQSFHKVVDGLIRTRLPNYHNDIVLFQEYFKNTYKQKCYRNIMQLFFMNVELNTFGYPNTATNLQKKEVFEKLQTYSIKEVVLGLAVIKKQNELDGECQKLVREHDRACKTSCELGLHWKRCDDSRNPFQVILNAFQSYISPKTFTFNSAKERVLAPDELFHSILSNTKKSGDIVRKLLDKQPPIQGQGNAAQAAIWSQLLLIQRIGVAAQEKNTTPIKDIQQDEALKILLRTKVSYQLRDLYATIDGYLSNAYGGSVQLKMTCLFLHYVLASRTIPAHILIRGDDKLITGFLPKWPNLWQNPSAFKYCVKVLMYRFNNGRPFTEADWRVVAINSEPAFERVMIEVMWQLCAWLEKHKCRRNFEDFLRLVFRFNDVVKNYFSALCAKLSIDEALYLKMSGQKWEPIIMKMDPELASYLNFQVPLPIEYKNNDFFAGDLGLQRILDQARPNQTDFGSSTRQSIGVAHHPFTEYGIFAMNAVEKPLRFEIDLQKLPVVSDNFGDMLVDTHKLRAVQGLPVSIDLDMEQPKPQIQNQSQAFPAVNPNSQPQMFPQHQYNQIIGHVSTQHYHTLDPFAKPTIATTFTDEKGKKWIINPVTQQLRGEDDSQSVSSHKQQDNTDYFGSSKNKRFQNLGSDEYEPIPEPFEDSRQPVSYQEDQQPDPEVVQNRPRRHQDVPDYHESSMSKIDQHENEEMKQAQHEVQEEVLENIEMGVGDEFSPVDAEMALDESESDIRNQITRAATNAPQ